MSELEIVRYCKLTAYNSCLLMLKPLDTKYKQNEMKWLLVQKLATDASAICDIGTNHMHERQI